jgi:hypothetical protein
VSTSNYKRFTNSHILCFTIARANSSTFSLGVTTQRLPTIEITSPPTSPGADCLTGSSDYDGFISVGRLNCCWMSPAQSFLASSLVEIYGQDDWSVWYICRSVILLLVLLVCLPCRLSWYGLCTETENTASTSSYIVACLSVAAVTWVGWCGNIFAEPLPNNSYLILFRNSDIELLRRNIYSHIYTAISFDLLNL